MVKIINMQIFSSSIKYLVLSKLFAKKKCFKFETSYKVINVIDLFYHHDFYEHLNGDY